MAICSARSPRLSIVPRWHGITIVPKAPPLRLGAVFSVCIGRSVLRRLLQRVLPVVPCKSEIHLAKVAIHSVNRKRSINHTLPPRA